MMRQLGFIGTGNMGGALARAAALDAENALLLANRHAEKAQSLLAALGGTGEVVDNVTAAARADYLFLGVKPYLLKTVMDEIGDTLRARQTPAVLVSMLAGTTIETIQTALGRRDPVIRIMPNTPVAVGEGLILYDCSGEVTQAQEQDFLRAMAHAGRSSRLEEHLLDAGSAVSGCGPAFAALFLEALADGGVACGLPRHKALAYAAQMLRGTAQLLLETGEHPGALKDAVCSPGGTTIQGVRTLEDAGFRGAVMDAVIAAYEKTKAL